MTNKYKLSDILQIVSRSFKQLFYDFDFWFESEITRVNLINGNVYIELVEFDYSQKIIAKARGNIFDIKIYDTFLEKVNIKNIQDLKGNKFLMKGRLQFHYEYGFSILINEISAEYTIGQFKLKQNDIIEQLKKDGIFEKNKNTNLGLPVYNIAVISSEFSQGLQDFQAILLQSQFNFDFKYYLCSIHGNDAILQVYEQLKKIYMDIKDGIKIDSVAIIRGGGGSSGILWQNDLNIAKSICFMPVPVIVAIGHTQDKSILDEISRFSAKTPSDAAYLLIDKMSFYLEDIDRCRQDVDLNVSNKIIYIKNDIENLYKNINIVVSNLSKKIESDLENFYKQILSFDPEKLRNYGYGILTDLDGEYFSKNQIENLTDSDFIKIKIYDYEIVTEIKSKNKLL